VAALPLLNAEDIVPLPQPHIDGKLSVESALRQRMSVRAYTEAPLTIAEVSQLVWAVQGISHADGLRIAPSAGALYPLTVSLVVVQVIFMLPTYGEQLVVFLQG